MDDPFYVDGVTGANSEPTLQKKPLSYTISCTLLSKAGFLLRKWNSSEPAVFQCIDLELRDFQSVHTIMDPEAEYTKTMGSEWNVSLNHFRLSVLNLPCLENVAKKAPVSDIARCPGLVLSNYSEAQDSSAMTVGKEGPMGLPSASTHTSSLVSMRE